MHEALDALGWYWPAAQSAHGVVALGVKRPAAHASHKAVLAAALNLPLAHATHEALDAAGCCCPAGQSAHGVVASGVKRPDVHVTHMEVPAPALNLPLGHGVHEPAASAEWPVSCCPAAQWKFKGAHCGLEPNASTCEHSPASAPPHAIECSPWGHTVLQCVHSAAPAVALNVCAGQLAHELLLVEGWCWPAGQLVHDCTSCGVAADWKCPLAQSEHEPLPPVTLYWPVAQRRRRS